MKGDFSYHQSIGPLERESNGSERAGGFRLSVSAVFQEAIHLKIFDKGILLFLMSDLTRIPRQRGEVDWFESEIRLFLADETSALFGV